MQSSYMIGFIKGISKGEVIGDIELPIKSALLLASLALFVGIV